MVNLSPDALEIRMQASKVGRRRSKTTYGPSFLLTRYAPLFLHGLYGRITRSGIFPIWVRCFPWSGALGGRPGSYQRPSWGPRGVRNESYWSARVTKERVSSDDQELSRLWSRVASDVMIRLSDSLADFFATGGTLNFSSAFMVLGTSAWCFR